ncbi:MAG: hypothetical protein RJA70_1222 [Pseudomonadota bacterium]|jgi:tetratricopeptide (TPR) repeat protein
MSQRIDTVSHRLDTEDLSLLLRRDVLPATDQKQLELALDNSRAARVLHDTGLAFDAMDCVQTGDDERIARLASHAVQSFGLQKSQKSWSPPRIGRRFIVAAAFVSSVAAAGVGSYAIVAQQAPFGRPTSVVEVTSPVEARERGSRVPHASSPAPTPSIDVIEVLALPLATEDTPSEDAVQLAGVGRTAESARPRVLSAEGLFSLANSARRTGDLGKALSAYDRLQSEHPASPEAHLSLVTAGKLHLRSGAARAALRQFDAYLKSGGSLSEEALGGKAQALQQLGLAGQERVVWEKLLMRFPRSVYLPSAKRRLNELAR